MKTLKILPLLLLVFLFSGHSVLAQEDDVIDEIQENQTITAVYNGLEDGAYNFSYKDGTDTFDITFSKIATEAQKMFDLSTKTYVGKKFELTFAEETVKEGDGEDAFLTSQRNILSLKLL